MAGLSAVFWRAVMAVTDVVEWRSIPPRIWDTVTRHLGQGAGQFLIGVGLVAMVMFAFVALAVFS